MADFPILSKDFDATSFSEKSENPVVTGGETEGGYQYTRPRFTRRPRKTFTFAYSDISEAERLILQNFWDARLGGSGAFNWVHPVTGVTHNVRFGDQMELTFTRIGFGTNHRWDSSEIILKEV
tara:strand:- start:1295 stop:1663 length:369 start_codon:yes stop_codon:yes gene_type:complete